MRALASKVRHLGAAAVVSPAMGGLVLGHEVPPTRSSVHFVEKEEGKLTLRRGFKILLGEESREASSRNRPAPATCTSLPKKAGKSSGFLFVLY
jgi:hypothetical protein